MDLRDRFTCFVKKIGLDQAIQDSFGLKCESFEKNLNNKCFTILVSGGIKQEGKEFEYRLSKKEQAMRDFLYYDLWGFLNKAHKNNKKLIWRVRPVFKKLNENEGFIYSRLHIN